MFKKIIAFALTVAIISCMAIVAVSAAEVTDSAVGAEVSGSAAGADSSSSGTGGSGDLIYFDANGWKNFSKVYCHIYQIGGDSFYDWQTPSEECKKVKGTTYSYDLSSLSGTTKSKLAGGMKSGGQYAVLFSANTGIQTYDTTIGTECKGDTLSLTGEQIENPVDSNKKGYEATWESNSSKYGPHLALTSIGNIVGDKLAPGESGIQVIGEWAPKYYNSTYCDPVKVLAAAYPKFGIKTSDDLTKAYAVAQSKVENGDFSTVSKEDLPDIKKVMEDAFVKAYPSQKGKTAIDTKKAEETAKKLESGEESVEDLANDSGSGDSGSGDSGSGDSGSGGSGGSGSTGGSGSGGSSGAGSSGSGGSYSGGSGSGDSSGSGADGQETTIFFVLGGVMIAAAGAMFISRKKKED